MEEALAAVYHGLKDGPSKGIIINAYFSNSTTEFMYSVYHRAINEGFAEAPPTNIGFGSEIGLRLSPEGRKYPHYYDYKDRHKKPDLNITNSILGNNNTGNNVGQGRDFLNSASPIRNTVPQQAQPKQNPATTNHTFWDKAKYISVIIGGIGGVGAMIAGLGKILNWW